MTRVLEHAKSAFNEVVVEQDGDLVELIVEGAVFASYHPREVLTGYSWDGLTAAALLGPRAPKSVLLLGLGGGTVCRQLRRALPAVEIVAVEIDPVIVRLAERFMDLESQEVEVVVDDAYAFLRTSARMFDVVIDDLYLTGPQDVERTHAPAGEVLALLRARARDRVIANLIVDTGHLEVHRQTVAAFRGAFDEVGLVCPPEGYNEIIVGGALGEDVVLRDYTTRFSETIDRERWEAIVVHR